VPHIHLEQRKEYVVKTKKVMLQDRFSVKPYETQKTKFLNQAKILKDRSDKKKKRLLISTKGKKVMCLYTHIHFQ